MAVAARKGWAVGALDVSTAFLNAELPEEVGEIIVRPPRKFVDYGLCKPDELWRAKHAIYGLRVSPRAWGIKRDSDLGNVRVQHDGLECKLVQSLVDPSVWSVVPVTEPRVESERMVFGYVLVYVDDFLILGASQLVTELTHAFQSL